VSGALPEDPERRPHAEGSTPVAAGASATLTVQAVFRDVEGRHVQTLAAEMIARAHELANQPECECDVDVSVQSAAPIAPIDEC
jgi:hypothetical protein